jgi:tetratricopeptide (TPR) repeat protein
VRGARGAASTSTTGSDTTLPVTPADIAPNDLVDVAPPAANETLPSGRPSIRLAPIAFRDIQPGVSMVADLDAKWGIPSHDATKLGSGQRIYKVEPFKQVDVSCEEGKVVAVVAHLPEPTSLDETVTRFVPDAERGVEVLDDRGEPLGVAYPERGVIIGFGPGGKQVAHLLFEPIDHETFLLRAERNQHLRPQTSMADVDFVLQRNPKHGPAHWLAAKIYHESGQLKEAATHIDAALESAPHEAAYRLTKAELLADSGDYTMSRAACQAVVQQHTLTPELKAEALSLLGDLFANGPQRDYKRATEHHLAAIQIAQPLSTSDHAATRRTAKRVLVEAQLGVANDIAWGYWQQKENVVPKWLVQAHQAAEDLIDREGADESLHLLVLRRALAACAGTQGKLDPVTWTKESISSARKLIDASDDPWRRGRLEWELGLALYDALQADQARGFHDHALANSSLVVKYLESGAQQRQPTPHDNYLLGRLYFRVGTIHAIELGDHTSAVTWFQKAVPLLEQPLPTTALADVGRLGESFVSIGISYWETGRRDEAMRLTQHGVALITQGIKDRVIEQDALTVPYSNLAFMHREQGNAKQADGFATMAARADGTRRQ